MTGHSKLAVVIEVDAVRAEGICLLMNQFIKSGALIQDVLFALELANEMQEFPGIFHYNGEEIVYE